MASLKKCIFKPTVIFKKIKRGEIKLTSNQFPMCSPQSGPLGEVHGVTKRREEKREEGDRGDQEKKKVNEKERDRSRH